MKQANYNGRHRAALAVLGVVLTASHRLRGAICLDIFPRMSPRFARLNTGLRTAATPPGCPARSAIKLRCRLRALRCRFGHCSASNWVADCVPCDADSSTALRAIGLPIACPAMPLQALLSEQLGCRLRTLRCRFSLAADGNQRGELAMPICPVGAVRCSVAFP